MLVSATVWAICFEIESVSGNNSSLHNYMKFWERRRDVVSGNIASDKSNITVLFDPMLFSVYRRLKWSRFMLLERHVICLAKSDIVWHIWRHVGKVVKVIECLTRNVVATYLSVRVCFWWGDVLPSQEVLSANYYGIWHSLEPYTWCL